MLVKKLFETFFLGISDINKKKFRKEKVKCLDCGYEWNCIFPKVSGGEYKLQCPKCGKRNSKPIN